jgi:hypothetical protein
VGWIEDCHAQAIFDSNKMGIEAATTYKQSVAGWNIILLRANHGEHFPLPNPTKIHKQKNPLPDLLEYFQEEQVPQASSENEAFLREIDQAILLNVTDS